MFLFISKLYKYTKITISGISAITAIGAIITGVMFGSGIGGTVLIIGGSLWAVVSCFSLYDSIIVHNAIAKDVEKLKHNVNTFSTENEKLHNNIKSLEDVKQCYIDENNKLSMTVKQANEQINKLTVIKSQYDKANQEYKKLLAKEKDHIQHLEDANNDYSKENDKLKMLNSEGAKQLLELQKQISKLRELYKNSVDLLKNLSQAGDMFNSFSDVITENIGDINNTKEDLETISNEMKMLIDKLRDSKFSEIDANKDGTVTPNEFDDYIKNTK